MHSDHPRDTKSMVFDYEWSFFRRSPLLTPKWLSIQVGGRFSDVVLSTGSTLYLDGTQGHTSNQQLAKQYIDKSCMC